MNAPSHLQHTENLLSIQSRICTQYFFMLMKRKSFIVELKNLVSKRKQVEAAKPCLAQIYEERKKQRKRSTLSSLCSHIIPLPTIMEEDEFPLFAGQFSRF
ncbi:unnamed protein product [Cylicocyclus nassatus]|uniref:Uncharacterized protein n=1 Tax=Cylicocyclus nassatus TaxID=53992 RepID=A0AA36DRM9_CYLNA|nr:unnamed protein product [Cylicocyclus nassatus]